MAPTTALLPVGVGAAGRQVEDAPALQTATPKCYRVPILKHPIPYMPREKLDSQELYFQNQRLNHWLRKPASTADAHRDEVKASEVDSFTFMLAEARRRSMRLHRDVKDSEGPSQFLAYRTAKPFLRSELYTGDSWYGFEKGDYAIISPDAGSEYQELVEDFCTIVGKSWEVGTFEVKFHVDSQLAIMKAEHLCKISKQEAVGRKMLAQRRASTVNVASQPSLQRTTSLPSMPRLATMQGRSTRPALVHRPRTH